jgi:phenylacetate-CoA ligase
MSETRRAWRHVVEKHMYHPDAPGSARYWVPETETAPRSRLKELQSEKLETMVRYLYDESAYYRRHFDELKLTPADVRAVDDLHKVPVMTKEALAHDQIAHPPWGKASPVTDELWAREGWMLFSTSGTTALPRAFRFTAHDRKLVTYKYARALYAAGVRGGHVAFNCFSYGPFVAFWGMQEALNLMGCAVIPGGGMDTKRRATLINHYRPNVLIATPSYVLYLAETMQQLGFDPAAVGVKFLCTGGEAGPCIPATKARMEAAWGGARLSDNFGTTEVAPAPVAYTCQVESQQNDRPMNMHLTEDMYIPEVLDPETWAPVAPGSRGVLVCTNLWSESQPFLRYVVGDYLQVSEQPCPCGRTHALAIGGPAGRPDDMVKVRGVVLFPSTIEAVVRVVPELTNEFLMVLTNEAGMDDLTVHVEAAAGVASDRYGGLAAHVQERIRTELGLRTTVEVLGPGSLPRTEFKAKRIKDLRRKA